MPRHDTLRDRNEHANSLLTFQGCAPLALCPEVRCGARLVHHPSDAELDAFSSCPRCGWSNFDDRQDARHARLHTGGDDGFAQEG